MAVSAGGAIQSMAAEYFSSSTPHLKSRTTTSFVNRTDLASSSSSFNQKNAQLRASQPRLSPASRRPNCKAMSTDSQNGSSRTTQDSENRISKEYGERVVVGDVEALDDDMKIKLECDDSGCVWVVGKKVAGLEDSKTEGYLHCGITGCFYDSREPEKDFKVLEGSGWRLGFETAPESEDSFCAMVGAGGWSIALTASEFNDFTNLIQMLRKGIVTMDHDGVIGREKVQMKVERGSVWMEAIFPGKRLPSLQKLWKFGERSENKAFEIRFQLAGDGERRQAEGYWPAEAIMDMLKKVDEVTATIPTTPLELPIEVEAVVEEESESEEVTAPAAATA